MDYFFRILQSYDLLKLFRFTVFFSFNQILSRSDAVIFKTTMENLLEFDQYDGFEGYVAAGKISTT